MKSTILIASIFVIISTFAINVYAVGQNNGAGVSNQTQQQTSNQGEDSQIQVQNNEQVQNGNGTGNQVQQQTQTTNQGESNQIKTQNQEEFKNGNGNQTQNQNQEQQGQVNAEQHRSAVANFVQSLSRIADKEVKVGEQVRTIAQQQNQSSGTTVQAIEKIQTRNKIQTFLFGSDYKNLGVLRSETVQTRNRLEQLNGLIENVRNEGDKTELQNQIQTLEQEQTKIENFIKAQEGKFSLFGWLAKLFQ